MQQNKGRTLALDMLLANSAQQLAFFRRLFSRAANAPKRTRALAPEEMIV